MLNIEEKIRAIEANQSTGSQEYIDADAARGNVSDRKIFIRKPLSGIIDLKSYGSIVLDSIHLSEPGKITRLLNIPSGLREFTCSKQMLMTVPAGLEKVEKLNLENNYITEIDLAKFTNLRVLNMKSNRLRSLKNIPESVEELYLDNNMIRSLNLNNLRRLRVVHCINNSMVRINNVPTTIVDLTAEHGNDRLHIDYSFDLTSLSEHDAANTTKRALPEVEAEYYDSLNQYFRLKKKYEMEMRNDREGVRAIANTRMMSSSQIKSRIASVKGKCVNCRRRVGTVFKQHEMRYLAYCGDSVEPCPLKIEIYRGDYMNRLDMIRYYDEVVSTVREDIIKHKMDTLFEYISDKQSASEFTELVNKYRSFSAIHKEKMDEYENLYFSESRKELVRLKQMKLYEIERRLEDLMAEYGRTHSPQLMSDFMDAMTKEYIPEKEQLRNIKYATMEMEKPNSKNMENLFQSPMDFTKLDHLSGEPPRVLQSMMTNN